MSNYHERNVREYYGGGYVPNNNCTRIIAAEPLITPPPTIYVGMSSYAPPSVHYQPVAAFGSPQYPTIVIHEPVITPNVAWW